MPRLDYRQTEKEIPIDEFVRALVSLVIQQLNQLRGFHGLAPLTRQQVIAAIKTEIKNLQ